MAFVAPEQRVLIEMLLSAVFCCLPRAVKVMQQFQDSSTGMVWVECLPLVKQPISLCCHLIQGIKGTRVERRQYGLSASDDLFMFFEGLLT